MYRALALFALASAVATASAGESAPATVTTNPQVTFESIDRNADHCISKTEAGSFKDLINEFAAIDRDGDGFISKSEFESRSPQTAQR